MEKKKIFSRSSVLFFLMVFLMFLALATLILKTQNNGGASSNSSWTPAMLRQYAGKLRSQGLSKQAVSAYEEYLAAAKTDGRTRANIYYIIGTMLMEEKKYEDALAYFYKSEIAQPDSRLKNEIGANIITVLENMGKGLDAQYALEKRTALSKDDLKKKPRGEIVAKIDKREIAMGEINDAIEKLPSWLAEQYKKDELKKLEFLQQYIFTELLYDKGRKLQYEKYPEIREKVEQAIKQLVAAKVVEDEIKKNVKIDPVDIKFYYEANKDKYIDEESKKQKSFEEVKSQVEHEYRWEKEKGVTDELLQRMLKSKDVQIYNWKFEPKKEEVKEKEEQQ